MILMPAEFTELLLHKQCELNLSHLILFGSICHQPIASTDLSTSSWGRWHQNNGKGIVQEEIVKIISSMDTASKSKAQIEVAQFCLGKKTSKHLVFPGRMG